MQSVLRGSTDPFAFESFVQSFEQQVRERSSSIAVISGNERLTFQELNSAANRLARRLLELGVRPEGRVAVCLPRSIQMVTALLAVAKTGAAYVPIDSANPPDRVARILEDACPTVFLTSGDFASFNVSSDVATLLVDAQAFAGPDENLDIVPKFDQLAYVIYTSGSTGQPKGVGVTFGNVSELFQSLRSVLGPRDGGVFLALANVAFDVSVPELFWSLGEGMQVVIAEQRVQSSGGSPVAQLIRQHRVTHLYVTPTFARLLLAELVPGDLASLEVVGIGAEMVPLEVAESLMHEIDGTLVNLYGPTETTVFCTARDVVAGPLDVGLPFPNSSVYVLDEDLQMVPYGDVGEVYISGSLLSRGYLNRPDLTASSFLPDPFSGDGARMYKSGDAGRITSEGMLEILGRLDHQVKVRGHRIELGEIETQALGDEHVRHAVAVLREDRPGDQRLVLYVQGKDIDEDHLRQRLRDTLASYMVPSAIVVVDNFPLTSNGKLDRSSLPAPVVVTSPTFVDSSGDPVARLVDVWRQVLGIDEVGPDSQFFQLGGHSLLALELIARLPEFQLTPTDIFTCPTPRSLYERIQNTNRTVSSSSSQDDLSPSERRLWFLQQLDPDDHSYNEPLAFRLTGSLDIARLREAYASVVNRHPVLRTRFPSKDGQPFRAVAEFALEDLAFVEERCDSESDAQTSFAALIRKPFDLTVEAPVRGAVISFGDNEHIVGWVFHHLIWDGWSAKVFASDLMDAFEDSDALKDRPNSISMPSLNVENRSVEFWRNYLADAPQVLALPRSPRRQTESDVTGRTVYRNLEEQVRVVAEQLAREYETTAFVVLLAMFQIFLFRYTRQQDFLLGTPTVVQQRRNAMREIGCFLETTVIRGNVDGNASIRSHVQHVKERWLQSLEHQHVPFDDVVRLTSASRDGSSQPLLQALFVMGVDQPDLRLGSLRALQMLLDPGTSKFDLTVEVTLETERPLLRVEYRTEMFDDAFVEQLAANFERLLVSGMENPDQQISDLQYLDREQEDRLTRGWNNTAIDCDLSESVEGMFERRAAELVSEPAIEWADGVLSYGELERKSRELACILQDLGVSAEVAVGICMDRKVEMIIAVVAVLRSGGVYVPLDPAYPRERLAFMAADSNMHVLLTERQFADRISKKPDHVIWMDQPLPRPTSNALAHRVVNRVADTLAYIIYTSGSTGRPKGVALGRWPLSNLISWHLRTLPGRSRVLQFASLSFDASFHEIFAALCAGGTLVLIGEDERLDAEALLDVIAGARVDKIILPVGMLQQLAELPKVDRLKDLQVVITTGEQLHVSHGIRRLFSSVIDQPLHNHYGPSETHVVTAEILEGDSQAWPVAPSIGVPIDNCAMYILDADLRLVPDGVVGELYIGGSCLARGYVGRPDTTADRFIPDPFAKESGSRMYKTGDLARRLPNGTIDFLGRTDHQVKIRGFRVELGEVEERLGEHPGIREVIVQARTEATGLQFLVAWIASAAQVDLDIAEVRSFLAQRLPTFMIPSRFVVLEDMPLTPTGKVDRAALTRRDLPTTSAGDRSACFERAAERLIAKMWSSALGVEVNSPTCDFFALGGRSLLATRLVTRVRSDFGVELPLRTLFDAPSVADFVRSIDTLLGDAAVTDAIAEVIEDVDALPA